MNPEFTRDLNNDALLDERVWHETTEENFHWMLECLPPIRSGKTDGGYGFMNSEPWLCANLIGSYEEKFLYFTCFASKGKYFACLASVQEWDVGALDPQQELPKLNCEVY